jgi:hypothetical protein
VSHLARLELIDHQSPSKFERCSDTAIQLEQTHDATTTTVINGGLTR